MSSSLSYAEDLSPLGFWLIVIALFGALGLLVLELRRRERLSLVVAVSGVLALAALAGALLRPARISTRGSLLGPRVLVLSDDSRRLDLPEAGKTRAVLAQGALAEIERRFAGARVDRRRFSLGAPSSDERAPGEPPATQSDLAGALEALRAAAAERPDAVVVLSDGRLTRPIEGLGADALRAALGVSGAPVHSVRLVERAPRDASVRSVKAAGAAVAHQALALQIEVGCGGGLACGDVPVSVRELRAQSAPALLASGVAKVVDGVGRIELSVTLDRAGVRLVEISIDAPDGDVIPENDSRIVPFSVARERVRLLHVAGRPTYDVRALRRWLKSDDSVDLVAFFILRTEEDDAGNEDDSELALIPFPVDELFTQHLPSFDAVVLQDIDAVRYKLAQYLPNLARYVESGGGLILVGGPAAFGGGGYAGTALDRVLPVAVPEEGPPFDAGGFVPRLTLAGESAPVLAALRDLVGGRLPELPGANLVGAPRPGAVVLWEHPRLRAGSSALPVLALAEAKDGRSIALGVDGTHLLAFSEYAAASAGRAFGALWDGLLGWLMRDPRFEPARAELVHECIAGAPARLRVTRAGPPVPFELSLERLAPASSPRRLPTVTPTGAVTEVDLGALEQGGYTARVSVGASPAARFDFACERGGEAWSDSRPDPERLRAIASATGGRSVALGDVGELPLPPPSVVAAERHVTPLLPPWVWSVAAIVLLGAHWVLRRRAGLI